MISPDIGTLIQNLANNVPSILIMIKSLKHVHPVQPNSQYGMALFVLDAQTINFMIQQPKDVFHVHLD